MVPIPQARESGFTSSTPIPLYWAKYGDPAGASFLVLHGGPGAEHDYLLPQMLALEASGRDIVFYDQRGGGRSRTDDRTPITWQTQVDDLALVISELRLKRLVLVGYSWGALLALLYMIEHSRERGGTLPTKAVLIDSGPVTRSYRDLFEAEFARRQSSSAIRTLRDQLGTSDLRERDPQAFKHRSFELSVAGYFADPQRARSLTPFRVIGRVQDSIWTSLGDFDLTRPGMLDSVTVPALFIHGRQDPIPLESSVQAAASMRARLVILEDCGHVPYVEQPEKLFEAIELFLSDSDLQNH
jgi:proline iminopeptidase